ncbi:MAG: methyl-accepting chemotaxis protein [Candidatus Marinarcus sp.]|uniref:methyl-accepting chemotaxis protein n=1 Tax=Candidatus Marinarcus sp. TaxID=3100987 RepID=UPI003B00EE1F
MLKNMSTRTKLMILPILFIMIQVISGLVYSHYEGITEKKSRAAEQTNNFMLQVLKGRISVYQFLRTPNDKNAKSVKSDFTELNEQVVKLESELELDTNINLCKEIIALNQAYIKYFEELAFKRIDELQKNQIVESSESLLIISKMVPIGLSLESKLKEINTTLMLEKQKADNILSNILLTITLIGIGLFLFITVVLANIIIKALKEFQTGLLSFFNYLNKVSDDVEHLDDSGKDEFSQMSKVVNENIAKTQNAIIEDNIFIDNVKAIVQEVKNGILYKQIEHDTHSKSLHELKVIFNEMLSIMAENICGDMNKIQRALSTFQQLDFRHRVPNPTGKTSQGLNQLAEIINAMLVENKKNGLILQSSANDLLFNVESLSSASNQAAASLEETAAALEEITSNIANNTENVIKMAGFANQLQQSANDGEKLAQETTVSMDNINEQVEAIYEAINVIDQIAFQTNILSLNAAVESATAGEAGKGFAVVAQEVRNLASRSAEAAKEIKELVSNATSKANYGKEIADKMIHGYHGLHENISKTLDIIQSVENASKEQYAGIEQINNAVAELDQQTQSNANVASTTKEIAIKTQGIAKVVVDNANEKEFIGKMELESSLFGF